jgi:steroid 5-alpha reductase family enzyme
MVKDHIQRGDYTYQVAPRVVFTINRMSVPIIGALLLLLFVENFNQLSDVFENDSAVIFLSCLLLSALKHVFWAWVLTRERFTWFMALFPWNNMLDWLWIYFLSRALNGNQQIYPWIYIGALLFLFGISLEFLSDFQLYLFKRDSNNRGKLLTNGLFSIVIHPNYTGYTLWRTALPLMTGYLWLAGIAFLVQVAQFYFHADPPFQRYMSAKYGQDWDRYISNHKKLFPGIL